MTNRGSAVVEFALIFPLAVAVLLAVVEVSLLARAQIEVVTAAREGAREAAVAVDPASAVDAARAALGGDGAGATVSVTRPQAVGAVARVSVVVPHRIAGGLFGIDIPLRATAAMRVER